MAASRTLRVIGPGTEKDELPPPVCPRLLRSPRVGFRPTTPQNAAGMRIEPPPSVAICRGPQSAAAAAAAPPLDPPGMWSRFHGLRVGPKKWLLVVIPLPNSWVAVLPTMM